MNRVTCHKCINVKREQIFFLAVRGGGGGGRGGGMKRWKFGKNSRTCDPYKLFKKKDKSHERQS